MPIVNVNVNLNLGHKAPAGKRAGKEIVSSPHQVDSFENKFGNWSKGIANVAAAA